MKAAAMGKKNGGDEFGRDGGKKSGVKWKGCKLQPTEKKPQSNWKKRLEKPPKKGWVTRGQGVGAATSQREGY